MLWLTVCSRRFMEELRNPTHTWPGRIAVSVHDVQPADAFSTLNEW